MRRSFSIAASSAVTYDALTIPSRNLVIHDLDMTFSRNGKLIAWALLAIAVILNILGYTNQLYQEWWWFDRVLHGYTIFAITLWLGTLFFGRALRPDYARSILAVLLIAFLGVAAGAIWEVAEWGLDQVASGNVIKGKYDTVLDVTVDTFGAILAAFGTVRFVVPSRHNTL
ncbi:MAG: hypothetical protein VYD57_13965 [Pseudomonadota bacterium]|nr:hypothetical protein [Pseudomonadota bacterium]